MDASTFAATGRTPAVRIVVGRHERSIAARLRTDLRRRGFVVSIGEPNVDATTDPRLMPLDTVPVVVVPFAEDEPRTGDRLLDYIEVISRRERPPIVLADVRDHRVGRAPSRKHAIIRYGEGLADYDSVFSELFVALLGPMPAWLDVRVHPSLVAAPTGVGWWDEDLFVADEHFGHVVCLTPDGQRVVVGGLTNPHHLRIDRAKLLVANTGAHRVLLGTLDLGGLRDVVTVKRAANKDFIRPHGVYQDEGLCVVADTDNHRVWLTSDDLWSAKRSRWRPLQVSGGLQFPCGVHVDGQWVWIADTFNHRLVVCNHDGEQVQDFAGYGWETGRFAYPVAIAHWRRRLLIADAEPQRVQLLRTARSDETPERPQLHEDAGVPELGAPWIGDPFGLAVNRSGRLAIADRQRRCVWLVDLASVPEGQDA